MNYCEHNGQLYIVDTSESTTWVFQDGICTECGHIHFERRMTKPEFCLSGQPVYDYKIVDGCWHSRMMQQAVDEIDHNHAELRRLSDLLAAAEKRVQGSNEKLAKLTHAVMGASKWWIDSISTAIDKVSQRAIHRDRNEFALDAIFELNSARVSIENTAARILEEQKERPYIQDMDDIPF